MTAQVGPGAGAARSTAAVLWLMILLVFLPIAALHAITRLNGATPAEPEAHHASLPVGLMSAGPTALR